MEEAKNAKKVDLDTAKQLRDQADAYTSFNSAKPNDWMGAAPGSPGRSQTRPPPIVIEGMRSSVKDSPFLTKKKFEK